MILPDTPLFNSKTSAEFRIRMIHYIKQNFKETLGPDINLLDLPNGLDLVLARVQNRLFDVSHGQIDLGNIESRKKAA